jgi:hypothetical protein
MDGSESVCEYVEWEVPHSKPIIFVPNSDETWMFFVQDPLFLKQAVCSVPTLASERTQRTTRLFGVCVCVCVCVCQFGSVGMTGGGERAFVLP